MSKTLSNLLVVSPAADLFQMQTISLVTGDLCKQVPTIVTGQVMDDSTPAVQIPILAHSFVQSGAVNLHSCRGA